MGLLNSVSVHHERAEDAFYQKMAAEIEKQKRRLLNTTIERCFMDVTKVNISDETFHVWLAEARQVAEGAQERSRVDRAKGSNEGTGDTPCGAE